jgi:hypothetical protein
LERGIFSGNLGRMPLALFYFVLLFVALGVLSFLGKLISILRAPSKATMHDAAELLCFIGLSGFAGGCGLMLSAQAHNQDMVSGVAVTAVGVLAALVGVAIQMQIQRKEGKSPEIPAAALAERKALADRLLGALGERQEAAAALSISRPRKKVPQWFFVPFALFGAFFVYHSALDLVHGYSSTHWPRTDGIITSASIEKHRQSGRHSHGYVYAAVIAYDYKVAAVAYTGKRVRFGMTESSEANAKAFVDNYPPGKQVAVFYSPSDPALAVLQTGIFGGVWLGLGLGGLFLIIGVVGLVARRSQ